MTGSGPEAGADVFISYSRRDGEFVRRLYQALTERGRSCWVDWEGIPPSAKWMEELEAAIASSQGFLFVISPDSIDSEVCRQELEHAASLKKRIIPLVASDPPSADLVPGDVKARNWLHFRETDDFEAAITRLEETLDTDPEWAREHTRLVVRASEWEASGRDESFALRGRDLTAAERWLGDADDRKDPQPSQLQTEYVLASRGAATRSQRRRMVALGAALLISSTLAVVALLQFRRAEGEADVARSRELASSSTFTRATSPDLALALAVESARVAETPEAMQALRDALEANHLVRQIEGPGEAVWAVAVDNEGEVAAMGDGGGRIWVWEIASDRTQVMARLDSGDAAVNSIAFDPNGRRIAVAAGDRALLMGIDGKQDPVVLGDHGSKVWSAAFDPAGHRIVTTAADGSVRVWDQRGKPMATTAGHPAAAFTAVFSPDGSQIASGGRDRFVRVWNARSGRELEQLPVMDDAARTGTIVDVNSLAFDPAGDRVLVGAADGVGRFLNLEGAEKPIELPSGQQEVYGVDVDSSGRLAATGSLDGKVRIWDVGDRDRDPQLVRTLLGHAGGVNSVAFVPESRLVLSASSDGTTREWEATSDDSMLTLRGHRQGVLGVAVDSSGEAAVTTSLDRTARVWNLVSGERIDVIEADRDVWSPALSADGTRLLAGVGDGTARVWELPDDRELSRFDGHGFRVDATAMDADAELAVTGSLERRSSAKSWDPSTGAEIAEFDRHRDYVFSAALSPDGTRALTAGADRVARVWDPYTGSEIGALEGHTDWVRDARYSPDGSRIVTASEDGTARIWDASTFETIQTLRGHEEGVLAAAFSPDGDRIATASTDRTVRVWDPESGALLDTLEGHRDWVNDIAFTPSGQILTASYDDTAKLMSCKLCLPFEQLLALAEDALTHELTAEERAQYLHE